MNLVCCTETILHDLSIPQTTQRHVAATYAMAIKSEVEKADKPDWKKINEAIVRRWSRAGLERIKNLAWKYLTPKD